MITDFPLFLFTVLVGLAAGVYVAAAVFPAKASSGLRPWLLPLVACALVVVGGLAAFAHLGRPALALNMLGNLASPLMLEGVTAGCLAVVAVVDLVLCVKRPAPLTAVRWVGAVAGLACLAAMTYAYATSYGNGAWISAPTYGLFLAGGLASGTALWAVLGNRGGAVALAAGVLNCLFAVVLVWQAAVFAGLGVAGFEAIAAGAVLAVAAAVVAFASVRAKGGDRGYAIALAVLAFAALAVSRYGFYMAGII